MTLTILNAAFLVLSCFYMGSIFLLILGLARLKTHHNNWQPFVSVIIPARNEEENIASCLQSVIHQNYPSHQFEIIVVDDRSKDNTSKVVESFIQGHSNLKLLQLGMNLPLSASPKKQAIQIGIQQSTGDVILTTDADSVVAPAWISTMVQQFDQQTGVVCGWVQLRKNNSLFARLQSMESFALVVAGAGAIGLGWPLIANGANLAYRRSVFDKIKGFDGIDHLASGDDDLFIQKVHRQTSWKTRFASLPESMALVKPVMTLREFFNQRKRWASKSLHYHKFSVILFLIFVYMYFLLLILGIPLIIAFSFPVIVWAFGVFAKLLSDLLLVYRGKKMICDELRIRDFILAEISQIIYVVAVVPWSLARGFEWKGRRFTK